MYDLEIRKKDQDVNYWKSNNESNISQAKTHQGL